MGRRITLVLRGAERNHAVNCDGMTTTTPDTRAALSEATADGSLATDGAEMAAITAALLSSYAEDPRASHIDRQSLPSRDEIIAIVRLMLQLFYPGYFGRQDLTASNVEAHVGALLEAARAKLEAQVTLCLSYGAERSRAGDDAGSRSGFDAVACAPQARAMTRRLLAQIPQMRASLLCDVEAAFDGDPAAHTVDEVILAYPGLLAITVYRVAHALHVMGIPLMPRIMTEWAHTQTGADIHPGAEIGPSFFIDHATGVVVGETTRIGARVKLYQGVTLGAISLPRDAGGRVIRGARRHPTVEEGVTVYANATVLGGETVVGSGSVVGGSVFLTKSVPSMSRVALKPPELRVHTPPGAVPAVGAEDEAFLSDI